MRMICSLLFLFALLALACDRVPQPTSSEVKQQEPVVKTETVEMSFESVIDRAIRRDKTGVEASHQKGQKDVVGAVDGKAWLAMGELGRHYYIKGIADMYSFNAEAYAAANDDMNNQMKIKGLEHNWEEEMPSYQIGLLALDKIDDRLREIIPGRTFADLSDAVTKFYRGNPLLKDRPVIWVFTVSLYREVIASRPKPAKGSWEESAAQRADLIRVTLRKAK